MSDQIRTIDRKVSSLCWPRSASVVALATRLHVGLEVLHLQGHLVQLVLAPETFSVQYPVFM